MKRNICIAAMCCFLGLLQARAAEAYTADTHAKINRLAADVVKRYDPDKRYAEIYDNATHLSALEDGGRLEDEYQNGLAVGRCGWGRFMKHFYNPYDPSGLGLSGGDGRCTSALVWARNSDGNQTWSGAIDAYDYTPESRRLAYRYLGQVAHLIGDMAQPDHVHLEAHVGGAFEKWVENNWRALGIPAADGLQKRTRISLEDYVRDMAKMTYDYSNFYGGTLSENASAPINPDSEFAEMFTVTYSRALGDVFRQWQLYNTTAFGGEHLGNWDGDYSSDDNFWETRLEANAGPSGYYYVEDLLTAKPAVFHGVSNTNSRTLGFLYASHLIPIAAEFDAGLYESFLDIVDRPPYARRVRMFQSSRVVYDEEWEDVPRTDGKTAGLLASRNLKANTADQMLSPETPVDIEIVFDQPVSENSIVVSIGGELVSGSLAVDGKIWTGTLALDASRRLEGRQVLKIWAIDKNEHYAGRTPDGSALDTDPASVARAQAVSPYRWVGYTAGGDANHVVVFAENAVDVALVIDVTGSMGEEIAGVRNALQRHLDDYKDDGKTTFQLTVFRDYVYQHGSTNDLASIRSQVGELTASGGGDCPEESVKAIETAAAVMRDGGQMLVATDASPRSGSIDGVIAKLRERGVRVNVMLSGTCGAIAARTSICRQCTESRAAVAGAGVDTLALRDDDFVTVSLPFSFPFAGTNRNEIHVCSNGVIGLSGGITATDGAPGGFGGGGDYLAPMWTDLDPSVGGVVSVDRKAKDVVIRFDRVPTYGGEGTVSFEVRLNDDGSFVFAYGDVAPPRACRVGAAIERAPLVPRAVDLSAAASPMLLDGTASVSEPFAPAAFDLGGQTLSFLPVGYAGTFVGAIDAFAMITNDTGGMIVIDGGVNDGSTRSQTRFENMVYNVVEGGLKPAVASCQPPEVPVGGEATMILYGSKTNFGSGSKITFEPNVLTLLERTVLSPTEIRCRVAPAGGTDGDFCDVVVTTDLGATVERAVGRGAIEIRGDVTENRILSVVPRVLFQGASTEVIVQGFKTAFDDETTVDLGPGLHVENLRVVAPDRLAFSVQTDELADRRRRDPKVTTSAGQVSIRGDWSVVLVAHAPAPRPRILSVEPFELRAGEPQWLTIRLAGFPSLAGRPALRIGGDDARVEAVELAPDGALRALVTARDGVSPGVRDVSVTLDAETAVALSAVFIRSIRPDRFRVYQNVPNPFNPSTRLPFDLANRGRVRLDVFDVAGRRIKTLISGELSPGHHEVEWDGRDDRGSRVGSGVYFARVVGERSTRTIKMVMLK